MPLSLLLAPYHFEMPPKSKKRRVNGEPITEDTVPPAPITPDRNTWPGWCEVESEPVRIPPRQTRRPFQGMDVEMSIANLHIKGLFQCHPT